LSLQQNNPRNKINQEVYPRHSQPTTCALLDFNPKFMERCLHREADSRSVGQKIPHILHNPKFHYRVHMSRLLDPILSPLNSAHLFTPYILKIHFNIILPPTCILPSGVFPSGFPTKFLQVFLAFYLSYSSHPTLENELLIPKRIFTLLYSQCVELYLHSPIRLHGIGA